MTPVPPEPGLIVSPCSGASAKYGPCQLERGHKGSHQFQGSRELLPAECFITLMGERGRDWQAAVGTRTFPVTSRRPEPASVLGNVVMAYFLDLRRVTPQLRARIEHFLAERFRSPLDQVRQEILEHGLPVMAKNVITPEGWVYGDDD